MKNHYIFGKSQSSNTRQGLEAIMEKQNERDYEAMSQSSNTRQGFEGYSELFKTEMRRSHNPLIRGKDWKMLSAGAFAALNDLLSQSSNTRQGLEESEVVKRHRVVWSQSSNTRQGLEEGLV